MKRQDYENLMKDCPRCGGRPKILQSVDWYSCSVDYYPHCKKCKLTTLGMFSTEILTVNAWNDLEVKI
jgi:endogenous inhibitor of DNA gyrase (YacG/DUF329 family)